MSGPALGPAQRSMRAGGFFCGGGVAGVWGWPLASSIADVGECVELFLHSPNALLWSGARLKGTGKALPLPVLS